ncbi:MAG: PilZ domain-containing protein [Sphingomonas sp.]|nr:MAG: PilZ domain-containing protein [Sphingomonas sp.]
MRSSGEQGMQTNVAVAGAEFANRRGAERFALDLAVRIGLADAPSTEARLSDLSTGGFRAHGALEARAGDQVWLRLTGQLPVAAKLVWSNEGVHGAAFVEPLAPALVRRMVALGTVYEEATRPERPAALVDLLRRTREGQEL